MKVSNFYYDVYLGNLLLRRYLSEQKAIEHYGLLCTKYPTEKARIEKIKRKKLSTEKKQTKSRIYLNVKQKNKKLSTKNKILVTNKSLGLVTTKSPQKNRVLNKKTRAMCAHACEKIGNHNLPCSVPRQIRSPETTPKLPFLFGVGLKNEKKTERRRPFTFGVKCFSKKAQRFFGGIA